MRKRARSVATIVRREYAFDPDACEKAIELLLKSCVDKKGSPALAAPDDAKEINNARATSKSSR